jgi:membrane protease YdiL (CAAX protease family)
MSPDKTPKDRAAEYRAQAQGVERGLAWLLVGAALLVTLGVTLRPGEAVLRPPARDVLNEVADEWDQGQHRGVAGLAGAAALCALVSAFVFWPRLLRSLGALEGAQATPEASTDPCEGESPKPPSEVRPRAPPLGLGVFVFAVGAAYFLQAAAGAAFVGDARAGFVVDGASFVLPRGGLRLVVEEGVAALSSATGSQGPRPLAHVEGGLTSIKVEVSEAKELATAPKVWLVSGTAAPTSATATLLPPGAAGEVTPGDSVWIGDRGFEVGGPGLSPILQGSVLGSGAALLGILFMLGLVGRGSEGGTPAAGLSAAGVTLTGFPREVMRGLLAYLALLPLLYLVMLLTQVLAQALGIPAEHHAYITALERDPSLAIWVVLAAGVAAPLLEEVLFRGLALTGLSQVFGPRGGLWAQALLFAAVHAGFSHLLPMLLLGWTLGALRRTSPAGSLVAPLTVHAAHNGVTLAFVLWALA